MKKSLFLILAVLIVPVQAQNLRRYQVEDIANPDKAEENEIAINQNFEDLWLYKVDTSTASNPQAPQFIIKDINDPEMADYNSVAFNQNINDLYIFKLSASTPSRLMDLMVGDLLDPERSEYNTYAINKAFDDLWVEKLER